MSKGVPSVLLVGVGRFGRNHARVLKNLHRAGRINLLGAVVRTVRSQKALSGSGAMPVFAGLTPHLLKGADAAIIATPPKTHEALVAQCLPHAHVFVEKPLSVSSRGADTLVRLAGRYRRVLMVGHIFRFHPLFLRLRTVVKRQRRALLRIEGNFISPVGTDRGEPAVFEELHFFDVLDALLGREPGPIWSRECGRITTVDLRYPGGPDARLRLGWEGDRKIRSLVFSFRPGAPYQSITADFVTGTLGLCTRDGRTRRETISSKEPLSLELSTFIDRVRGAPEGKGQAVFPDGALGARIVAIAERARPRRDPRPRIAIIGGGIFGMTAALVLGRKFPVTVFERHGDILAEASYANQYRHHRGYHYPRSAETIRQIQEATRDFESCYRAAIVRLPSFYCIAARGSKVSRKDFKRMCRAHGLPCREGYPPAPLLDRASVGFCIRTNEAVYDHRRLKRIIYARLRRNPRISLRLGATVESVSLTPNGGKRVRVRQRGKVRSGRYDYVINAMYANYNSFPTWLGFPRRELEYRFKEIIVADLGRVPRAAVTVMDGPFATIVPIPGTPYVTFGDVPLSVHRTLRDGYHPGAFAAWCRRVRSRWERMRRRSSRWFPVLHNARYVSSLYVTLPIDTASIKDDARPTVVTEHGFGCFSILEGKIITAVSVAKQLQRSIERGG